MIYRFCLEESTEAKASGEALIHTMEDILNVALDIRSSNILKLDKDAILKSFTSSSYIALISNIKAINPNLAIETDYALEETTDDVIRRINCARDIRDVMYALSAHPKEGLETIKMLSAKVLDYSKEAQEVSAKLAEVGHTVTDLENENDSLRNELKKVRESRDYYATLTEVMRNRYEGRFLTPLEESSLNYCQINSFDKVVMFKEITPVKDFTNMLKALINIAGKVNDVPGRLLVIAPYGNYMMRYQFPELKYYLDLTTKDILSGDIICSGFQHKVVTDILRNGSKVSTLYVYDATGTSIQHIVGNNVQVYYLCADDAIMAAMQLDPNVCIGAGNLKIEEIPNREVLSNSDILGIYSKQSIIQTILANERR